MDILSRQPNSGYEEKFMHRALDLARLAATLDEVPVGAVVVKNGKIVGEGHNQSITNDDPTAHAEIVAMRNACVALGNYRLTDCDLYVTVEPCTMCVGAMVHARIKCVYFGAPEPRAGALQSQLQLLNNGPYNHSIDWFGGFFADQCSAVISDFFREKRRNR
jgi:tRNA(adenine34) deaminase